MVFVGKKSRLWLAATALGVLGLSNQVLANAGNEASQTVELPNPLTLEYVLSHPLNQHPELQLQQSKLNQLVAQQALQTSADKTQLNLVGRLAWREYANDTEDFHLAAIHASHRLYDFGQSSALIESLQAKQQAQKTLAVESEKQLQLQIMQAFFNVLLADFQYRIDNEAMAIAYVGFDKAKDRLALQRMSDVDYLAIETEYEKIRVKRMRAEYNQLQTRLALANLMGLPDARPDELTLPKLKQFKQRDIKTLKLEALQQQVINNNSSIQALKQQLQAAALELQSKQAQGKPTLTLDAWAGQLSSYPDIREGNWKVGLLVDMPLYDGGATDAKVSQVKATIQQIEAQIKLTEQALRDQVADLYFQLKMLRAEKLQNQVFGDYADLYLDYSRALYENESATDLGDAMVRLSQANYDHVTWTFKQALLWSKLDVMMAKPILSEPKTSSLEPAK